MKRKLLSVLLAAVCLLALLPQLSDKAVAADTSWYSGEGPYDISSAAALFGLAELVNAGESFEGKSFVLTDDIDLSGMAWTPIGTGENSKKHFRGSIDGGGFTISGLSVSGSFVCAGLVGYFEQGTIKNLTLDKSCRVSASGNNVGTIAGVCGGTLFACYSEAAVDFSYSGTATNVGGLVGYLNNQGQISDCESLGFVSVSGSSRENVGGLTGLNMGTILRSVNKASVSAKGGRAVNNAGGITGFDNGGTTRNCYSRGSVTASNGSENCAGGIAGRQSSSSGGIYNCYSTGTISASGASALRGGVVGRRLAGTVFYCYYKKSGGLTGFGGAADKSGFATALPGAQMTAESGDAYGVWSPVTVDGYNLGGTAMVDALNRAVTEEPPIWKQTTEENDGYPIFAVYNWLDEGESHYLFADFSWLDAASGGESDPYLLSDAEDLAGLAALVNESSGKTLSGIDPLGGENYCKGRATDFEGKYLKLAGDIDLSGKLWTPIGDEKHPFKGSFSGDCYAVTGMSIGTDKTYSTLPLTGLFGYSGGCISDTVMGKKCAIFVSGSKGEPLCVGGICARSTGLISGCRSDVDITVADAGELYVGGIVGESLGQSARVCRCSNSGMITADQSGERALCGVGGIAGFSGRETKQETYKNHENEDEAERCAVISCFNTGTLELVSRAKSARALLGGIVGINALIRNQSSYVSPMLGEGATESDEPDSDYSASVLNCYSSGTVLLTLRGEGAKGAVGGIAGASVAQDSRSELISMFESGGVSETDRNRYTNEGFISKRIEAFSQVKNCFALGEVKSNLLKGEKLLKGGVAGLLSPSLAETENCYYMSGCVSADSFGIGGVTEDSGAVKAYSVNETTQKLSEWAKANDKELCTWGAASEAQPYLCFRLSYDANGGDKAPVDERIYVADEAARVNVLEVPEREDHVFLGWARSASAAKAEFIPPKKDATAAEMKKAQEAAVLSKLTGDTVLYAVWQSTAPKSQNDYTETKKNADGTTTTYVVSEKVAQNGDKTVNTTETKKNAGGKVIETKTVSSFYDSAKGTTTEQVKTKTDSAVTYSASFLMDDAQKVSALPPELSKQLRSGKLESLTLSDKAGGMSMTLDWEKDESGTRLGQRALIESDKLGGTVKLPEMLLKELKNGGYKELSAVPLKGVQLSLSSDAIKKLGDKAELSAQRSGNSFSLIIDGKAPTVEGRMTVDYAAADSDAVIVAEGVSESGERKRVPVSFSGASVSFSFLPGQSEYSLSELAFPFADVLASDWFYDTVRQIFGSGLMSGVSEAEFAPNAPASRAMLVTILWRAAGEPESASGGFADVSADAWYAKAVSWAARQGIVNGVSEGSFAPDMPVTREQLVTILYRLEKYAGDADELNELTQFTDAASVSDYARTAMRWACQEKIISGRADGSLDPAGEAKRCELAAVLLRIQAR